ncbi:MAG: YgiT-type zinc finger protein [Anaerolineales bacterium]
MIKPGKDKDLNQTVAICPECPAGLMRMRHITYFTWLNQELVTVPNFPAWICDICGRREFDLNAITWLNTLLNPAAGRSRTNRSRRKGGSTRTDIIQP